MNWATCRPIQRPSASLLIEVFSQRYDQDARGRSTPESAVKNEWTKVIGSERLTVSMVDRLTHHVHILEMNGESFRLIQSKKKRAHSLG